MDKYKTWVGFVFVFNLIVGTGSLLLPSAFQKTGYLLSTFFVVFLTFTSYMTATFVIEALAASNAILKWKKIKFLKRSGSIQSDNNHSDTTNEVESTSSSDDEERALVSEPNDLENTPLTIENNNFYTLDEKFEMGEMARIFFPSYGSLLFYVCIAIYLFGDLSIYSAAVSTTIRDVICDSNNETEVNDTNILCWKDSTTNATRFDIYRICQVTFTLLLGPFVFFNLSKTKHLQFITLSFRIIAFAVMIGIASKRILFPTAGQVIPTPPEFNVANVPFLIGSLIYAFMSHHSLPQILTLVLEKDKVSRIVSLDYLLISLLYLVLALTGIFAFNDIKDLYTLNFLPPRSEQQSEMLKIVEYFLALFPVFTLTTTYPIVAITLRNNLQTLFVEKSQLSSCNFFVRNMIFPLMAIIPPFIITFNTESVKSLVSFTGCYAGAFIQYMIPITLVFFARKTCANILGHGIVNEFGSPFKSNFWLVLIFSWTCISLVLVSIHLFQTV